MTTAHRPTWAPARGGEEQGGMRIFAPSKQVSAKNQAAHTKMKFRWGAGACAAAVHSVCGLGRSIDTLQWGCICPDGRFVFCECRQEGQAAPHELKSQDLKV